VSPSPRIHRDEDCTARLQDHLSALKKNPATAVELLKSIQTQIKKKKKKKKKKTMKRLFNCSAIKHS